MIDELPYTQIAKPFVQTKTRFWQRDVDFSILSSDTSYERVFNLSTQMGDTRGLLLNWINGDGLRAICGDGCAAALGDGHRLDDVGVAGAAGPVRKGNHRELG